MRWLAFAHAAARELALVATIGGAALVMLIYAPSLHAPFLVPKFATLDVAGALGLVAFALAWIGDGAPARVERGVGAGTALVLASTMLSWAAAAHGPLGAPLAPAALLRWLSPLGIAAAVVVLSSDGAARARLVRAVAATVALVAALGLLQHAGALPFAIPVFSTPGSTFGNRNLAAEVVAMALPLSLVGALRAAGRGARTALVAALAIELVYLAATRTRGAWLGAAAGLAPTLWLARRRLPRHALPIGAALLAATMLAAALPGRFDRRDAGDTKRYGGVLELLRDGADVNGTALRTRFGLWRRTLAITAEHPLLGVGPGNWPRVFPRFAEPGAARDGVLTIARAPRQAHDDALERAAETGLLGLVALAAFAAATIGAARAGLTAADGERRLDVAAGAGSLMTLSVLSITGFPLAMPATLVLAGIALGLLAYRGPAPATSPTVAPAVPRVGRRIGLAMLALALCFAAWVALRAERTVRSSLALGAAERALRADAGAAGATVALAHVDRALAATPRDFRAWLRRSQMLLRLDRAAEAERAATRALAIEPYEPWAWAARAAAAHAQGDAAAARRHAGEALALLHDFPFALWVRAAAAERDGDALTAEADRARLRELTSSSDRATARSASSLLKNPPRVGPAR